MRYPGTVVSLCEHPTFHARIEERGDVRRVVPSRIVNAYVGPNEAVMLAAFAFSVRARDSVLPKARVLPLVRALASFLRCNRLIDVLWLADALCKKELLSLPEETTPLGSEPFLLLCTRAEASVFWKHEDSYLVLPHVGDTLMAWARSQKDLRTLKDDAAEKAVFAWQHFKKESSWL